ncbi:MAG: hypothetical protein FJZ10_03225 [Candidatus Omnitrophica bacterium]|nr:hypothetical protein [Candidatus Omnitrophota bacterium]
MKRIILISILALAITLFFDAAALKITPAFATVLIGYEFDEIVAGSSEIIRATVVNKTSGHAEDKRAYTHITFRTIESLKGDTKPQEEFTLTFLGGNLQDGKIYVIDGMPEFEVGDEVIVFLSDQQNPICPIKGWGQGLFKAKLGENGQKYLIDGYGKKVLDIKNGKLIKATAAKNEERPKPIIIETSGVTAVLAEDTNEQMQNTAPLSLEGFKTKLSTLIVALPGQTDEPEETGQPSLKETLVPADDQDSLEPFNQTQPEPIKINPLLKRLPATGGRSDD